MFQINAILNPSALDDVLQGLQEEEIQGVTISDVIGKGCLNSSDQKLIKKVMIIVLVANNSYKERALEAIRANAQDIVHGAGKMWVTAVMEVERIRTGEKDIDALTLTAKKEASCDLDAEVFNTMDTPAS